jgi:hypothetical protein
MVVVYFFFADDFLIALLPDTGQYLTSPCLTQLCLNG